MHPKDVAIFQNAAGKELEMYNYELAPYNKKLSFLSKCYYFIENEVHREYKTRFK